MTRNIHEADVSFIQALAELLKTNDLSELSVKREYGEDDSLEVRVVRYTSQQPGVAPVALATAAPQQLLAPAPATIVADIDDPTAHPGAVTSPMVGVAYLAAEPGAKDFVAVGSSVAEGDTLMIIEAMKTMNQIPAPRAGIVRRILVADGSPVEYGAPLMIIE